MDVFESFFTIKIIDFLVKEIIEAQTLKISSILKKENFYYYIQTSCPDPELPGI